MSKGRLKGVAFACEVPDLTSRVGATGEAPAAGMRAFSRDINAIKKCENPTNGQPLRDSSR